MWRTAEERFVAYHSLCSPSDLLYVSYPTSSATGDTKRPSLLIKQLQNMFCNNPIQISELSPTYFCTTEHATFFKMEKNNN